jgi:hypothetical protein
MSNGQWSNGQLGWDPAGQVPKPYLNHTDLNDSISNITPPIGGIIGWLKSFTGVPGTLPSGYVECNGQTLSDANSPLNGQVIPNLNNSGGAATNRFLRGNTTSGGTGGTETHTHTISGSAETPAGSGCSELLSLTSASQSTLPSYYEVVFIMRVK